MDVNPLIFFCFDPSPKRKFFSSNLRCRWRGLKLRSLSSLRDPTAAVVRVCRAMVETPNDASVLAACRWDVVKKKWGNVNVKCFLALYGPQIVITTRKVHIYHLSQLYMGHLTCRMVDFTFPLQLEGTCLPQKKMFCPRFSISYGWDCIGIYIYI